jgi:hypothetical protein
MNAIEFYQQMRKQSDARQNPLRKRSGSKFFSPVTGENKVRLLPWSCDPSDLPEHLAEAFTLRDDKDQPILDDEGNRIVFTSSFVPISVHYNLGTKKPFTCGETFGEDCIVCNRGWELWGEYKQATDGLSESAKKAYDPDKEFFRKHMNVNRYFTFALIYPSPDETDISKASLMPWIFGKKIWEEISNMMLRTHKSGKKKGEFIFGDVTDAETGRAIYFTKIGDNRDRYSIDYTDFQADDKPEPIDPEALEVPDFYECMLEEMPYDEGWGRQAIMALASDRVGEATNAEDDSDEAEEMLDQSTATPTAPSNRRDSLDLIRQRMKQSGNGKNPDDLDV